MFRKPNKQNTNSKPTQNPFPTTTSHTDQNHNILVAHTNTTTTKAPPQQQLTPCIQSNGTAPMVKVRACGPLILNITQINHGQKAKQAKHQFKTNTKHNLDHNKPHRSNPQHPRRPHQHNHHNSPTTKTTYPNLPPTSGPMAHPP
jgi:hypothetical protein